LLFYWARHIVCLLVFSIAFCHMRGQDATLWSFDYFGSAEGLPSSEVISVYQDHQRYIWIGHSAGVSRWDGYSFQNYLWAGSQRIGKTYQVRQDAGKRIWICAEGGLFLFDSDRLKHISTGKENMPVFNVLFLQNVVWLGTMEGPAMYAIEEWNNELGDDTISLNILPSWKRSFPTGNEAKQIDQARDGNIFIADAYALFAIEGNTHRRIWMHKDDREHVTGLKPLNKDSIYFTTTSRGLQALEKGMYRIVDSVSGTGNALQWQGSRLLYFATKGLYHFNPVTNCEQTILLLPEAYNKWGSSVLADQEHGYWIGTHEQLLHAKPGLFQTLSLPQLEGFDELYYSTQLRDGNVLVGGNRGRVFTRSPGGTFAFLLKSFPLAPVAQLYEDSDATIWLGSYYQGIASIRGNAVKIYTTKEGLRDNTNFFFAATKNGKLYTGGDGGVSEVIRNAGQVSFKNYALVGPSGDYPVFRSGMETLQGSLLFGGNWGLYKLVQDSLQPLSIRGAQTNSAITDMQQDNKGNIWISTNGNGILLCKEENNAIRLMKLFSEKNGLNASTYTDLLLDKDNVLWAASYKGLSRIEEQGGQYFIMNLQRNFIRAYHSISLMQDKEGVLWIPTSSGLAWLHPDKVKQSFTPPVLSWTSCYSLKEKKDIPISQLNNEMQFPYNENAFQFTFTGISLSPPAPVHYFYRIKELDTAWTDNGFSRQVSFQSLAPGKYTFEVKAHAGSSTPGTIQLSFTIAPPFWTRWWFITLLVIAIAAIILFAVRRRENIIKAREHEKAALKLTALRAQMNPHFIFNALNSVQHYILRGDADEANKYLSKFSKLQRLILNHCDQQFISLEKELEMLNLYLQLEQLRVKGNFDYAINIDEDIDPEEVNIPPMILQPFIENAIWHGLMPKHGGGFLKLNISMDKQFLICLIEDNGIGREASSILKNQQAASGNHHSKGLKLVEERLEILRQQYGQPFEFSISDITGESNAVTGTVVKLTIYTGETAN